MQKITKIISNLCFASGIFVSGIYYEKIHKKNRVSYSGNLRIDESDPSSPPLMFLELQCSYEDVCNSDEVVLKVVKRNYVCKNRKENK